MARLEDLTVGSRVTGVIGYKPVTIVAVKWVWYGCLRGDIQRHQRTAWESACVQRR